MLNNVENRRRFSVIIFVSSLFQLVLFSYFTGIPAYVNDITSARDFIVVFCAIFPQYIIMIILSVLTRLASPWPIIYCIYVAILVVVFILGSLWTAFVTESFNIFELIK